ncbi:hypothetical protein DL96DRAFT_1054637 [Flagelloscypha sp. PMI_526]|nr:hypothetical protein DL96DRAFT_1054637 [Flagelloscypha sp. PMI_526]
MSSFTSISSVQVNTVLPCPFSTWIPQNTRPVTPLVSSDNEDVLLHLSRLMEKQLELLQRMDARQVAADVSKQTIPQAPALSNAAWLPLLKSFRDHIDPVIERARSGLDALLVFIGLFSAYRHYASKDLEFDPTRRTNALLVNLTEVIVALHRSNGTNLDILYHDTFKPDEGSTRFNLFLSLSLILSLAGAVLAIICRGFLTSLTWSRFRDASRKLTDIHKRWDAAERFLFPMVHALTPSMILPVLLFLVGLLDHLFDLWNSVMHPIISFGTALYFEAGLLIALGLLVAALTLHGILRPGSSPFQSVVSRFILSARAYSQRPRFVSQEQILAFHQAVQHCQDDDLLDQAASSVVEMVKCSEKLLPVTEKEDLTALEASEADMLLHLLSVESSYRTNLTAASVIIERSQFAGDSIQDLP